MDRLRNTLRVIAHSNPSREDFNHEALFLETEPSEVPQEKCDLLTSRILSVKQT